MHIIKALKEGDSYISDQQSCPILSSFPPRSGPISTSSFWYQKRFNFGFFLHFLKMPLTKVGETSKPFLNSTRSKLEKRLYNEFTETHCMSRTDCLRRPAKTRIGNMSPRKYFEKCTTRILMLILKSTK